MDKEDLMFGVCLLIMVGFVGYLGFFMGRKYEVKFWREAIPAQMNQLCLDCANIGKEGLR